MDHYTFSKQNEIYLLTKLISTINRLYKKIYVKLGEKKSCKKKITNQQQKRILHIIGQSCLSEIKIGGIPWPLTTCITSDTIKNSPHVPYSD